MIRKFLEGLVFGAGLALAFLVVLATGLLVVPVTFTSAPQVVEGPVRTAPVAESPKAGAPQFHDLPVEDQIKQASVIALARYEPGPDGRMRAIIKEFLKKAPDTTIQYNIGDEFTLGSYYPKGNEDHGDGVIAFFAGSPAQMKLSMTYSGDRIRGLGDIPVELFKEKCKTDA